MQYFHSTFALFLAAASISTAAATTDGRCEHDGVTYNNGQHFDMGCMGRCECRGGSIGCVSMCPPFIVPGSCRKLKPTGECCRAADCMYPAESLPKYNKIDAADEGWSRQTFEPQWQVLVEVGDDGQRKDKCSAVIMQNELLYASPDCQITNLSKIVYPRGRTTPVLKVGVTSPLRSINRRFVLIGLEPSLNLNKTVHEINTPDSSVCKKNDNALYVTYYDPIESKMRLAKAKPADNSECRLNPVQVTEGKRCLEIPDDAYPSNCQNFAGSSVVIRRENYFFLIGLLSDAPPFSPKDNRMCDQHRGKFRIYDNICGIICDDLQFDKL